MFHKFSLAALVVLMALLMVVILSPALVSEGARAQEIGATATQIRLVVTTEEIIPEPDAVITVSGWGDITEQQVVSDSIARFNTHYPTVTVHYEPIPSNYDNEMLARMAEGTAPDVFYVNDQLMDAFAPSGDLLALDSYMAQAGVSRGDFITSLLTIFTLDDITYGLPKDWNTLGLIYLPDAFAAAGIPEPTESWTWDDVAQAARAISNTGRYAGFCQNPDWARLAPWVFGNGGAYTSDNYRSATLNTLAVKNAAQFILDMKTEGSLVQAGDVGASWCGEAIGQELVGMTYEGGWMVSFMRQTYPDVNWKAVLIPAGPKTRADVIFTNAWGINAHTAYPNATALFVLYMTGRENMAEIVETGFAYSPHPDQWDLIEDPNDRAIAAGGLLPDSRVAYWGPCTSVVNSAVNNALERIYAGEQTVDEAFAQAQEEAQACLPGYQLFLPIILRNLDR